MSKSKRIIEAEHRYISPKGMIDSWDYWIDSHEKIALPFINSQNEFKASVRRDTPREVLTLKNQAELSTVAGKLHNIHCGKSSGGGVTIKRIGKIDKSLFCNSHVRRRVSECTNYQYPHWNTPTELIDEITTAKQAQQFLADKDIYGLVTLVDHTNSNGFRLVQPPNFQFVFFAYKNIPANHLRSIPRNKEGDRWGVYWKGIPKPRILSSKEFFQKLNKVL